MNNHRIEVYHFSDGSVYISPRSGVKRSKENIMKDAHSRADVKSPVYVKSRNGELVRVTHDLMTGLSKKNAKIYQIAVIRAYESLGVTVHNVRI